MWSGMWEQVIKPQTRDQAGLAHPDTLPTVALEFLGKVGTVWRSAGVTALIYSGMCKTICLIFIQTYVDIYIIDTYKDKICTFTRHSSMNQLLAKNSSVDREPAWMSGHNPDSRPDILPLPCCKRIVHGKSIKIIQYILCSTGWELWPSLLWRLIQETGEVGQQGSREVSRRQGHQKDL